MPFDLIVLATLLDNLS